MGIEIIFLIVVLGLLFDYTNGFHDAANVVATPIATKVVTPLVAIVWLRFLTLLERRRSAALLRPLRRALLKCLMHLKPWCWRQLSERSSGTS